MNLIFLLTLGTIFAVVFGEFGKYPFGGSTTISLLDIMLAATVMFLLIWQLAIEKNIIMHKTFKIMIVFWLVGLLSLIFSRNLGGGLYLIRFIFYSSTLWLGYSLTKEFKTDTIKMHHYIIYSGLCISFLGLMQLVIFPDLQLFTLFGYDPHKYRLVSTFLDPNLTGAYLNIVLMLIVYILYTKFSFKWLTALIVILASIVFTFSRSAYLMLLIQLSVFSIFKAKKMLLLMILTFLVLYLVLPRFAERIQGGLNVDKSASERVGSWQRGLYFFQKAPLLGIGFNNLRENTIKYNLHQVFSIDGGHSGAGIDSSFIFLLVTTGLTGTLMMSLFWYEVMMNLVRKFQRYNHTFALCLFATILGLLINSQFINSLFYPPIMFLTFLLIGLYTGSND